MPSWNVEEARCAMAAAPFADVDTLCGVEGAIAVIAPHPDDETLGCGGLIAQATDRGRRVVVLLMTDGEASHPDSKTHPASRLAAVRRDEARAAIRTLAGSAASLESFGAPDGRFGDHIEEAAAWIVQRLAAYGATCAFVTWEADPHPDHRAAHAAAVAAARRALITLWSYPVWGLTAPGADSAGARGEWRRLDVRDTLARKAQAIAQHASQTTNLIGDDVNGFRLTSDDLARHLSGIETFLSIR